MNDRLLKLCLTQLYKKNLNNDVHKSRLKYELRQISIKEDEDYFLELYDKKVKYPFNQYNLLTAYLLNLVDDFDINVEAAYEQGEMPDIDVDYIPQVQKYIKNDWAPKTFGERNVCSIGTVGALGIKSAILDMTKLHDLDKSEIQAITVMMDDKDDEGKILDWDKALELYPEFAKFCEKNPLVAEDAKAMLDRSKSAGIHAGGLIISSVPIDDFVPLEVRKVDPKTGEGVIVSAWSEGLKTQDLQAVGLVKFDVLSIINLLQIAFIIKLIKERHPEVKSICALEGDSDWSDTSYLNDPLAIEMANKGDLRCVFQYDSDGIRKLVQRGGVTSFDDLVAYAALYRPGCLTMGMDARYYKRKKGEEEYFLHPLIEPVLGGTYGVMVFQEQVMQILHVVGGIPLIYCEKVRKAISKKKVEAFQKYKEMFLINGQKNLQANLDFVQNLWDQVVAFADYGFNKSVLMYTKIPYIKNGEIHQKQIKDFVPGDIVFCINQEGEIVETEVVALHDHGELEGFEVTFDDGYQVTCSANHKFLTENGQVSLSNICKTRSYISCAQRYKECYAKETKKRVEESLRTEFCEQKRTQQSSEELRKVQGNTSTAKIREIEVHFQMRREDVNTRENVGTSKGLQTMSSISLEEINRNSCCSMRNGVSNLERSRNSSQDLREVRRDQTKQHQDQNGQIKQRQFSSREKENIFGNGSQNFNSTRTIETEGCESQEMAGRESREVCQMHRGSLEEPETISNGDLVENSTWVEFRENSLRENSKASGFCERQHLDRGGRILSFLRTQKQFGESIQTSNGSNQRQDAERGMPQKGQHNASAVEHGVFSFFDGSDEVGDMGLGANHAPITDTGNLVYRKIVRVRSVGKCHMFDLEVANPTHNFILPNGIVTSNSHSTAYTYMSSRLLWLKAHYPLEFYTAILMCEKTTDNFKDYCVDAAAHGVDVRSVDINKSKDNFSIVDNKLYFGFSNIKMIGTEVAQEIISKQPYTSFKDFLERFGTSMSVLKALISIGVFDELEPNIDHETLYKFAVYYADLVKKKHVAYNRYLESLKKQKEDLRNLLKTEIAEDDPNFDLYCSFSDESVQAWEKFKEIYKEEPYNYKGEQRVRGTNFYNLLIKILKKNQSTIRNHELKQAEDEISTVQISNFNANKVKIKENKDFELMLKNYVSYKGRRFYPLAESFYYGFQWSSNVERSPLYKGYTIDLFMSRVQAEKIPEEYIEVEILKVDKRKSKSGTEFYSVTVEDANGKNATVNVWLDDYIRFAEDLKKGNLVRMLVRPPSGGYKTFSFSSPQKRFRHKLPKNKEDDLRLVVLPESNEDPRVNLEDLVMED